MSAHSIPFSSCVISITDIFLVSTRPQAHYYIFKVIHPVFDKESDFFFGKAVTEGSMDLILRGIQDVQLRSAFGNGFCFKVQVERLIKFVPGFIYIREIIQQVKLDRIFRKASDNHFFCFSGFPSTICTTAIMEHISGSPGSMASNSAGNFFASSSCPPLLIFLFLILLI